MGLEQAGFDHLALVDDEPYCCETLRLNRPSWNVSGEDLRKFSGEPYRDQVDLLAGGVPCPPFSVAGQGLGAADERDLFPEALRLVEEIHPKAVMIENVRGILSGEFDAYRADFSRAVAALGYQPMGWRLLNASDFGVPQLRPRTIFVALREGMQDGFAWPRTAAMEPDADPQLWRVAPSVGEALYDLMAARGWPGAERWRETADDIAPTIVGGSKKHGGPDLGPTRAKRAWAALGVNGHLVWNEPPGPDFEGDPCLTVRMVARLQGFPDDWQFAGRKTASYRQVGNAFPPPVARAVAERIRLAIEAAAPVTAAG